MSDKIIAAGRYPGTEEIEGIEWEFMEAKEDLIDGLIQLYDWADYYRVLIV